MKRCVWLVCLVLPRCLDLNCPASEQQSSAAAGQEAAKLPADYAYVSQTERLYRRPGYVCEEVQYKDGSWVKGYSHWQELATSGGTHLRYASSGPPTDKNETVQGHYLSFNPRAEDPQVLLARDAGPGAVWKIEELPRVRNREFGYKIYTRISPASGPMKGWILSVEGEKLTLVKDGKPAKIYAYIDDLNDGK